MLQQEISAIKGIAKDNSVWRLDWLGDCGHLTTVKRYDQPIIRAVFSPLVCYTDDQATLLFLGTTDHHHHKRKFGRLYQHCRF